MARTSLAAVTEVIDTNLTDGQVQLFIDDANQWVTDFLGSEGVAAARLEAIEKYLAAHYITLRDPRERSVSVGPVTEQFQRDTQVTEYLRQAIAEDPTGIVKARLLDQEEAATVEFRIGGFSE